MLRALIIEFLVQSLDITLFPFLLLFELRLIELVWTFDIQRSIVIIFLLFLPFHRGILLSLLCLSWLLLHRLDGLFPVISDGRDRFLLIAPWLLLSLGRRLLSRFVPSSPQSFDLFIDNLGIIIILSPNGLLFPFLKATDLNRYALESIDLILDILGLIVILILHSLFLLHLKFLDPGHGSLINIHTGLTGGILLMNRRQLLSTGAIEGESDDTYLIEQILIIGMILPEH